MRRELSDQPTARKAPSVRVRFRLTAADELAVDRIASRCELDTGAEVLRAAISISAKLVLLRRDSMVLLQRADCQVQEELYLGPLQTVPRGQSFGGEAPIWEIRCDKNDMSQLDELSSELFGDSRTAVVRRAIHLLDFLSQRMSAGWDCVRVMPNGTVVRAVLPDLVRLCSASLAPRDTESILAPSSSTVEPVSLAAYTRDLEEQSVVEVSVVESHKCFAWYSVFTTEIQKTLPFKYLSQGDAVPINMHFFVTTFAI